jgi:tetratricopeptide (TPR) repeat protein
MSLEKYDKAIKNFDRALSLDMNNDEIRQMRSEARKLKGLQERDNDQSIKDLSLKSLKRMQKFKDMENWDEIQKMLFSENPALEHVWAGHEYRDNQNYRMAAECYKKVSYNHVYIVDEECLCTLRPRNTRTLSLFRYPFSILLILSSAIANPG